MFRRHPLRGTPPKNSDEESQISQVKSNLPNETPWIGVICTCLTVLAIGGFCVELFNEHRRITAQIAEHIARGPPLGCAGAPRRTQAWFEWMIGVNALRAD